MEQITPEQLMEDIALNGRAVQDEELESEDK